MSTLLELNLFCTNTAYNRVVYTYITSIGVPQFPYTGVVLYYNRKQSGRLSSLCLYSCK